MSSSDRRGQVEPLPALLALAVFAIGLSVYGTSLESSLHRGEPTVDDGDVRRVLESLESGTVVQPKRMSRLPMRTPSGEHVSVVLRADGRVWRSGPHRPERSATVSRRVLVATPSGVVAGRLRVSTWE
ncbi:MAG: hypothetical protein ABEJ58_08085 [Halodesulfurarchaeum sp.]